MFLVDSGAAFNSLRLETAGIMKVVGADHNFETDD
jgi:hypothetical protein